MNALRRAFAPSTMMASTAATMLVSSASSSLTYCAEKNNDGSGDNDSFDVFVSKVKDIAGGKLDFNKELDMLGNEVGSKVRCSFDKDYLLD